jgi:hypothetical protein
LTISSHLPSIIINMKDIFTTLAASGLLATAYASQEQVVFDGYPHQSVKPKQVAIIGMNGSILSDSAL